MNLNKLSPQALNKRRVQAVKLRLNGESLDQIQASTGLTHPTIISAYKTFLQGGWPAVPVKDRGRQKNSGHKYQQIKNAWLHMHNRLVQQDTLWDTQKLQTWLLDNESLSISTKTIARHLTNWGIKLNYQWDQYPVAINSKSQKIYFSCAVPSSFDLDNKRNDKTFALCAQDLRGQLIWSCFSDQLTETVLLEFCQSIAISNSSDKTITVYIQSYPLNNFPLLNAWLDSQTAFNLIVLDPINTHEKVENESDTEKTTINDPLLQSSTVRNTMALTHLERLEAESIQIMREVISKTENPVMLYSVGKDSAVMLHLAMKAFYPSKPPFSFLHVDTGWKFREMYEFRDKMVKDLGIDLIVYKNPAGAEQDINPFTHGSALHTDIMKTQGLKQALDKYKFDAAFGGARRDEEKSRAKERIFSFRTADHRWDPKNQRPELWKNYNANKKPGESIRVFPISNWTELDIWQYIYLEKIPVVPLYLAAKRPVVERDGMLVMVDDERMPMQPGEVPMMRSVRFRTLGCYPLTGAVESTANTLPEIIQEMLLTKTSERQGRMIDKDSFASMEKKKQEGYF